MQGVRTTRGCIGCRRRKRSCDLGRPSCSRCIRLGVDCRYEKREFTFVGYQGDSHGRDQAINTTLSDVDRHATTVRATRMTTATHTRLAPSTGFLCHASLATTDAALILDSAFWELYTPSANATASIDVANPVVTGGIQAMSSAAWIPAVRALAMQHNDLRIMTLALACTAVGSVRDDHTLVRQAVVMYTRALQAISHELQRLQQQQSPSSAVQLQQRDEVIFACCRLFSLFEMLRQPRLRKLTASSLPAEENHALSWQTHVQGLCQLAQVRWAQSTPSSSPGHALFDATRLTGLVLGIISRRPNALTARAPVEIADGTLRGRLFMVMNLVPKLLQRIDALLTQDRSTTESVATHDLLHLAKKGVLAHALRLCNQLNAWESQAISHCEGQRSEAKMLQKPFRPLKDHCTEFGDDFFLLCCLYWAACINLYDSVQKLNEALSKYAWIAAGVADSTTTTAAESSQGHALPSWINPKAVAHNLSCVAPHFFRPEAGLWSAQMSIFPLTSALKYFASQGQCESAEMGAIIHAFASHRNGAVLTSFVGSVMSGHAEDGALAKAFDVVQACGGDNDTFVIAALEQ